MALRAVQHGQYYKNGGKVVTYLVSGSVAEVAKYVAIQMAASNRTEWPSVNGQPLFFVSERTELSNGNYPEPSYDLGFNQGETKIIRDTLKADMVRATQMKTLIMNEEATLLAKRRLGIDIGGQAQRAPQVRTTAPAPAGQPAPNEIAELIADGVDGGTQGAGDTDKQPELTNAGDQTLAD